MNYSELLQLAKGWGNFVSDRINIWRLPYTCLLFIEKNERKTFEIGFVKDINRFYATESAEMKEYPIEYLSAAPWTFFVQ